MVDSTSSTPQLFHHSVSIKVINCSISSVNFLVMEDDIVTMLHQKGVTHLVDEIFSYLNYGDIKSATQVSRNWRHHLLTNSRVWKNLWDRNIAHLPTWNSLYKRAVCLQTIPEWNPQEACKVIGDAYQKVLHNVQQGKYTEKVDNESKSFLCEIGSTKVVTAGNLNQIHVQNRWRLNEEATSFHITHRPHDILQLEINEPYLSAVIYRKEEQRLSSRSVIVFDLEKEKKIHEFIIPDTMNNLKLTDVKVKCNDQILITCCDFWDGEDPFVFESLFTARRMPCSAETDFPVIDELNIRGPDFIFLEDQRIVLIYLSNTRATVSIMSTKPLRIIREHQFVIQYRNKIKYWNGWLLQSNGISDNGYLPQIGIMNIDSTELNVTLDIKHLKFDIINNYLVTFSASERSLKFEVFHLPRIADGSKDLNLLFSFQLHNMDPYWDLYEWKLGFDGVQFWLCLYNRVSTIPAKNTLAVRDYTCCGSS